MTKVKNYKCVWDAIEDTPELAANMRIRSELMQQLSKIIKKSGWNQFEAAKHCGVTQPCIDDLLCGRLSHFSLDALISIATSIGSRVHMTIESTEK